MDALQQIRLLEIEDVKTIHNPKDKQAQIHCRKSFGLSLCTEGRITYTLNGRQYISDPEHAIFLPQGQTYHMHTDKGGSFPLINFSCAGLSAEKFLVIPLKNPTACLRVFSRLQELKLLGRSQLKLMQAFYELLDLISLDNAHGRAELSPALAYLESHLSDPGLSNRVLAQHAGFSEVYFRRLFTQCFSMPPRQYILELRIRKAKQLLTDSRISVTAISEECGFSSVYHFSRLFKERTGLPPTEYARQNRVHKI